MNGRLPVSLLLLLMACSEGPHPGYTELRPQMWFRLNVLGEGGALDTADQPVRVRLRAARIGERPGSLFSTERDYVASELRDAGLGDVLARCQVGDSVSLIAPAQAITWNRLASATPITMPDTGMIAIELSFLAEREPERAVVRGLSPEAERGLLDSLVKSDGRWKRWGTSQLHYRILEPGNDTLAISKGQEVTITYTGLLPDSTVIDGLRDRGGELTFVFGDPDQVIEGLEVAVSLLHDGGSGRFLIPSELAFGALGGGAGSVPPNMPLIYEVEVLRVVRGPDGPS